MATRIDLDVTLRHENAAWIAGCLADYAADQQRYAHRTKNAVTSKAARERAFRAATLAGDIMTQLYDWVDGEVSHA